MFIVVLRPLKHVATVCCGLKINKHVSNINLITCFALHKSPNDPQRRKNCILEEHVSQTKYLLNSFEFLVRHVRLKVKTNNFLPRRRLNCKTPLFNLPKALPRMSANCLTKYHHTFGISFLIPS